MVDSQPTKVIHVRLSHSTTAAVERLIDELGISQPGIVRLMMERGLAAEGADSAALHEGIIQGECIAVTGQNILSRWMHRIGKQVNWDPREMRKIPDQLRVLLGETE